jgi:hypothetical protein
MNTPSTALAIALFLLAQGCVCKTRDSAPLPAAQQQAAAVCLTQIRACQLPDGAFAQVAPGSRPNAPVWIAPYFANFAALALLAGHAHAQNPEDLARVERWLAWCAAHQTAEGYWTDFEGVCAAYRDTGKVDAWDSSAALFLLVAERYRRAGGTLTPEALAAAQRAFDCLTFVTDSDGLTWAKPDYRMKYLMDNVEVRAGLRAAATLFDATGAAPAARQAREQADRLTRRITGFWQPAQSRFAYVLRADGTFGCGLEKAYPHGLAQLYGIAFIAPQAETWETVKKTFQPETGPAAACGAEWWLMAAARLGKSEARTWRDRVIKSTDAFSPQRTYLHRYALSVLALLDGAWLSKD